MTAQMPAEMPAPLHVVLILDHAHVNGGQAKVAIDSAIGLRARGHDVSLFAAVGPVDPRLTEAGVAVICLDQDDVRSTRNKLAFAAQVIWNSVGATALGRFLDRCDPERTLVHVHGWAKALSPAIGPVLKASGLPLLYTMHEFFLVCPNGGFYEYPAAQLCHRVPMSRSCIACNCDSQSYPRKLLRVARHAGLDYLSGLRTMFPHIVTISALQESVAKPFLPASTTFHRVNNPISVVDEGPPTGEPGDFLFVGRLSPEKGAEIFAEAARLAGVRPVFAGDGPSGDALKARYPEARFLGWKSAAEVLPLMRAARALVFPSVWYEGQPLTVYEALAAGTPVIVSDACAGREAIEDGENGFWFRSGDAGSLAAHLTALKDDDLARRMKRAAHGNYWASPLTLDLHLDRLLEIYALVAHREETAATARHTLPARLIGAA